MLKNLIIALYEKVNLKKVSEETQKLIVEILEENDLDKQDKIPLWFQECLEAILAQKVVGRTHYDYDSKQGDVTNLIAELEDIIEADWNDYGEAVEVTFPNLNMKACISTEGNFYEVSTKSKK